MDPQNLNPLIISLALDSYQILYITTISVRICFGELVKFLPGKK